MLSCRRCEMSLCQSLRSCECELSPLLSQQQSFFHWSRWCVLECVIAHAVISITDAKVTGFRTVARRLWSGSEGRKMACFSWTFLRRHFFLFCCSSAAAKLRSCSLLCREDQCLIPSVCVMHCLLLLCVTTVLSD